LDSSFAADSIADTSIADTSIVDTSIIDSNNSLVIDIDVDETSGDENSISMFLESETSAGDAGSGTDAGNETDNTAELLANLPKKKTVTFDEVPSVSDKILESLANGTNSKDAVTSQYIKTTAQYDSCNKASHTQPQSNIHLVHKIAYPTE
jgi:hypothetical protein